MSAKQKKVLTRILALYEQLPSDKKDTFLSLFSFEGEIHQSLQIRDHYLQKMQSFMLIVFDAQWVLEILLANSINRLILELDQDTLNSTIIQLPNRIKWPLHSLLTLDEPNVLCEYALSEEEVALIFKIQECVQHILEQTKKEDVLACCRVEQRIDEKTLSVKDRAHNKWAKFAERELKHELLDLAEANDVFMLLLKKLKNVSLLKSLLEELHALYPSLSVWDDEAVIRFYTLSRDIDTHLFQLQQAKKTADAGPYQDAQILLNNFTNISMNAIINARLDQIDVFTAKSGDNPLLAVPAIITWLSGVQKNNQDLRSLMEQQIQQAPSLDHTLWRCKCILQAMEQPNPGAKIAKTGMQSLLRFWSQHNGNVTTTGEPYIHPMTSEMTRVAPDVLFHGSVTLQHSMERVREKLPAASFFNRPPSVPVDEDDDNEPLPMARAMAY